MDVRFVAAKWEVWRGEMAEKSRVTVRVGKGQSGVGASVILALLHLDSALLHV